MIKKYNIVFYPTTKVADLTAVAQQFKSFSDKYLLKEDAFPHVTLYQFEAEESAISGIWNKAQENFSQKSIHLKLATLNSAYINNRCWLSLIPDNIQRLHELHAEVAVLLNSPVRTGFDPHLTLINSLQKDYEPAMNKFSETFASMEDEFTLALGESDQIGQLRRVIYNSVV